MKKKFELFELKKIQAPNFLMSPVELREYIDFDVKRIYYITHTTGPSGQHCHKIEKEFFILIAGACTAVIDQGNGREDIPLSGPTSAIYCANFIWHGFKDFSPDAILLALSSTNYDPKREDYVENYDDYIRFRDTEFKKQPQ